MKEEEEGSVIAHEIWQQLCFEIWDFFQRFDVIRQLKHYGGARLSLGSKKCS